MNHPVWMTLLLCPVTLAGLLGCAASATLPAATPKAAGKLSTRLEVLAQSPGLSTASADEQARALSLPAQGSGSLMHNAQGQILVNIRTTDLSANGLQTLRDSGATITNVSDQYQVVTAFVAIVNLSAIANLPPVQSMQEELAPGAGGGAMFPTPP